MRYNAPVQERDPTILKTWIPLADAAVAYSLSERTIRRRITQGQIDYGYIGKDLRIKPPGELGAPPAEAPERAPSQGMIHISQVEQLLAPYVEAQDRIQAERDALRTQLDAVQEQRLTDAHRIGELEGELRAVQAELERSRELSPANPPIHPPASAVPRRRWPWQR